jgi:DNA-binding transcriptional ArsR family regulator
VAFSGGEYTSYDLYKSILALRALGAYAGCVSAQAAFPALADPRRREMLLLVRDEPRSVNEIAEHFDITQQAVSQHLRVLRDAGLVDVRAEGQRRLYLVRPEGLESLEAFLAEIWPANLERLKNAIETDHAL